jgi:hypothetical protein
MKREGGIGAADQLFSQLLSMAEEDLALPLLVRLFDHDVTQLLTLILSEGGEMR